MVLTWRCDFTDGGSQAFLHTTAEQDYFPLNSTMADILWNSRGLESDTYTVMGLGPFFQLLSFSDEHAVPALRTRLSSPCAGGSEITDESLSQR